MTFEMMFNMCIHQQVRRYVWSSGKEIVIRPDKITRMLIDMHTDPKNDESTQNKRQIVNEFMQMSDEGIEEIHVNVPGTGYTINFLTGKGSVPVTEYVAKRKKKVSVTENFNKFAPVRVGTVVSSPDS